MLSQASSLRVIKRRQPSTTVYESSIAVSNTAKTRREKYSVTDELAKDLFNYVNYLVPALQSKFPDNQKLWFVDKCYPYAEGGPLYVDTPYSPQEIDICQLKKEVMRESNLRYVSITQQMDLQEAFQELEGCMI